jgi:hypothetical protein
MRLATYAPLAAALEQATVEELSGEGELARLARRLGVRLVLAGEPVNEDGPGDRRAGSVRPPTVRVGLHELPGALPPLWLPARAEGWQGGGALAWATAAEPGELAHLPPTASGGPLPWASRLPARLALVRQAPTWLGARLSTGEPRWLASSVLQDGGWHLLADGSRLPTTIGGGPFLAAWLPADARRLELLYRPRGLLAGALLAALAAAAALAWLPLPARGPAGRLQSRGRALTTPARGEYIGPLPSVSPRS